MSNTALSVYNFGHHGVSVCFRSKVSYFLERLDPQSKHHRSWVMFVLQGDGAATASPKGHPSLVAASSLQLAAPDLVRLLGLHWRLDAKVYLHDRYLL